MKIFLKMLRKLKKSYLVNAVLGEKMSVDDKLISLMKLV